MFKSDFRALTAVLALGALSTGFAPVAAAISSYDAMAEFTLKLTNVTDIYGTQVTSDWYVTAFSSGGVTANSCCGDSATGSVSLIDPSVSMSLLDSITQSSASSGSATSSFASTDALSNLDISVANNSSQKLIFSFDFSAMVDATTTTAIPGIFSEANATVALQDQLGFVNILAVAETMDGNPATGSGNLIGTIEVELLAGVFNLISATVNTLGSATAVPEPADDWLIGSGLSGLVGLARRKTHV